MCEVEACPDERLGREVRASLVWGPDLMKPYRIMEQERASRLALVPS